MYSNFFSENSRPAVSLFSGYSRLEELPFEYKPLARSRGSVKQPLMSFDYLTFVHSFVGLFGVQHEMKKSDYEDMVRCLFEFSAIALRRQLALFVIFLVPVVCVTAWIEKNTFQRFTIVCPDLEKCGGDFGMI